LADDNHQSPDPFDVRTIRYLVRLMSHHDLSEIDLREGTVRIRLRRGTRMRAAAPPAPLPASTTGPTAAPPAPTPPPPEQPGRKLLEIRSPAPGTFYAQREPGKPPLVTVGSRVTPETVVGLLEAMKIYSDITADCSGVIAEVLVTDKQPVEYNTVLFRVDPTG
jgi:acetyl-CoA carboxylase biotin carboxyl carrier protein